MSAQKNSKPFLKHVDSIMVQKQSPVTKRTASQSFTKEEDEEKHQSSSKARASLATNSSKKDSTNGLKRVRLDPRFHSEKAKKQAEVEDDEDEDDEDDDENEDDDMMDYENDENDEDDEDGMDFDDDDDDDDDDNNEQDDEDDEDDDEEEEEDENGEIIKKAPKQISKKAKAKQDRLERKKHFFSMTPDELKQLQEGENVSKTNLFRMQVDELLKEAKVNYEKQKKIESALMELKNLIESIPNDKKEIEISSKDLSYSGIHLPVLTNINTSFSFKYSKPASFVLTGSFALKTIAKPVLEIDVVIQMPDSLFQPKDYLNYRYHVKRALYLAKIASVLKQSTNFNNIEFGLTHDNDISKPILLVSPSGQESSKYLIKLYPCISPSTFKLSKLSPDRNCLRAHKLFSTTSSNAQDDDDAEDNNLKAGPATPLYNRSIVFDMLFASHLTTIHSSLSQSNSGALANLIVLLKLWLRAKGLNNTLSGLQISLLVSYLLESKRLTLFMTGIQLFRVCLEFLANTDLTQQALKFVSTDSKAPTTLLFQQAFDVTLVDPSGYFNVLGSLTRSSYQELKYHATLSAASFDDPVNDSFESIFGSKINPASFYDQFLIIHPLPSANTCLNPKQTQSIEDIQDDFLKYNANYGNCIARQVHSILSKGLNDRISLLTVKSLWVNIENGSTSTHPNSGRWSVNTSHVYSSHLKIWDLNLENSNTKKKKGEANQQQQQQLGLFIGIVLNPETSLRIVDVGPSADELEEAAAFRELWGPKSELRRFKDGRICEAVVWEDSKVNQRHLLTRSIILYLLELHFHLQDLNSTAGNTHIYHSGAQLDHLLAPMKWSLGAHKLHHNKPSTDPSDDELGLEDDALSRTRGILTAFDNLSRVIRNIRDLPLSVASLQGLSSVFRYCEMFPPQPIPGATRPSSTNLPPLVSSNSSVTNEDGSTRVAWIPAAEVMLQFESSSRWPVDLDAVQKLKTAFLIKLAEALATRHLKDHNQGSTAKPAEKKGNDKNKRKAKKPQVDQNEDDNESGEDGETKLEGVAGLFGGKGIPSLLSADHLDVCADGIVFRIYVYHEKEATLIRVLDRQKQKRSGMLVGNGAANTGANAEANNADNDNDDENENETEESRNALLENSKRLLPSLFPNGVTAVEYERFFTQRAIHTSTIHSFASAHPFFISTVRLAKRWVHAHLLTESFSDECIELLVARVFAHAKPYSQPSSVFSGFLRFLSLLGHFDFFSSPLIVDLASETAEHNQLSARDALQIETHFKRNRAVLPPLCIFSQLDPNESRWTTKSPSVGMLNRAAVFARACEKLLLSASNNPYSSDEVFESAFTTSLVDFDALIHLKPAHIPRLHHNIKAESFLPLFVRASKYKNIAFASTLSGGSTSTQGEASLLVAFDPVRRYVDELNRLFSDYAIFAFDDCGGTVVAVAWKPTAKVPQPLRVTRIHSLMPASLDSTENANKSDLKTKLIANLPALLEDIELLGEGLVDRIELLKPL